MKKMFILTAMLVTSVQAMDIDLSKEVIFDKAGSMLDMPLRFGINQFEDPLCIAHHTIQPAQNATVVELMHSRTFMTDVALGGILEKIVIRPSDYSEYPSGDYQRIDISTSNYSSSFYCAIKKDQANNTEVNQSHLLKQKVAAGLSSVNVAGQNTVED